MRDFRATSALIIILLINNMAKKTLEELKKTLEELEVIEHERKEERKRVALSIQLEICPECGEKLKEENTEVLKEPIYHFFGLFKQTEKVWDERLVCKNCKFEHKQNFYHMGHLG